MLGVELSNLYSIPSFSALVFVSVKRRCGRCTCFSRLLRNYINPFLRRALNRP